MYSFDKVHGIGPAILRMETKTQMQMQMQTEMKMEMETRTTMIRDAKAVERRLGHGISTMKISQGCPRQCQNGAIFSFRDGTITYQLSTISGSWTILTTSL